MDDANLNSRQDWSASWEVASLDAI